MAMKLLQSPTYIPLMSSEAGNFTLSGGIQTRAYTAFVHVWVSFRAIRALLIINAFCMTL